MKVSERDRAMVLVPNVLFKNSTKEEEMKIFPILLLCAALMGACAAPHARMQTRSSWASERPMPEWAKHDSPWRKGKFVYAAGRAGTEIRDMVVRMRIAELNGKRKLISADSCHSILVGSLLDETWVAPDETVYALVHTEAEIVLREC